MKKYVIIAGVNGAGKSTLYQLNENLKNMPRVNVDEIVREFGDWKNVSDVFTAGKMAVRKISLYFEQGLSFNQETTLCGKAIVKNILKAKSLGYFIELHYIGVDSVEIAKERVKYRVVKGGHGIPDSDIEKRYDETFKQLNGILSECNLIAFYDNTESFRRFAICKNGELVRLSHTVPVWFSKVRINKVKLSNSFLPLGYVPQTEEQIAETERRERLYEYYGIPYGVFDGKDGILEKDEIEKDRTEAQILIMQGKEIPKDLEERLLRYKEQNNDKS